MFAILSSFLYFRAMPSVVPPSLMTIQKAAPLLLLIIIIMIRLEFSYFIYLASLVYPVDFTTICKAGF